MTQEEATRLIGGIYDSIFDSITKAAPGGKPIAAPASTMLSLAKPAKTIKSTDYSNPWTPGNNLGSKQAALNVITLVDDAIKLSALYTPSGGVNISDVYGQIMDGVHIKAQAPDPATDKQLDDAFNVLSRKVQVPDPDTGVPAEKTLDTTLYADYKTNLTAYNAQALAYTNAYLEAQKTVAGKANWPLLAPALQVPVKIAYDQWRSNYADKVEQALAIQQTSSQNSLSKAFKKAKDIFMSYGVALDETGSATTTGTQRLSYRSSLLPSDWYSTRSNGWATFDSNTVNYNQNNSSDYKSGGGAAGFSLGIFSVGGGGGHSQENRHMDAQTTNVQVSFMYKLVTINRPWLTLSILGTQGWDLSNLYSKGQISNGSKLNQLNAKMPLMPTGFVIAKQIKITAKWSQQDLEYIKKQTSAGGGFSIGPFSIGGSYTGSSTHSTYTSSINGDTIVAPDMQIIGWLSQVVPYAPAL